MKARIGLTNGRVTQVHFASVAEEVVRGRDLVQPCYGVLRSPRILRPT